MYIKLKVESTDKVCNTREDANYYTNKSTRKNYKNCEVGKYHLKEVEFKFNDKKVGSPTHPCQNEKMCNQFLKSRAAPQIYNSLFTILMCSYNQSNSSTKSTSIL